MRSITFNPTGPGQSSWLVDVDTSIVGTAFAGANSCFSMTVTDTGLLSTDLDADSAVDRLYLASQFGYGYPPVFGFDFPVSAGSRIYYTYSGAFPAVLYVNP